MDNTARFIITLTALMAFTIGAALLAVPADGSGVASPVNFYSDCEDGSIHYDYHNNTAAGVTVVWSRVIYPKKYGFDRNTTLAYWERYLGAGESFTARISGVGTATEGTGLTIGVNGPEGIEIEAHLNGKYVAHWRLRDDTGATWTIRKVIRVECPNG